MTMTWHTSSAMNVLLLWVDLLSCMCHIYSPAEFYDGSLRL